MLWNEATDIIHEVWSGLPDSLDLCAFFTVNIGFFLLILHIANELSFDPLKKCSSFINATQSIESLKNFTD